MGDNDFEFQVLINSEEQYSLWPKLKSIPDGWVQVGPVGAKAECLNFIENVWIDMRPKSVRDILQNVDEGS